MRIISKFHDYYDGVGRSDLDREVIYHRDQTQLRDVPDIFPKITSYWAYRSLVNHHRSYERHDIIIGFCGKIYGAIKYFAYDTQCHEGSNIFLYSLAEVEQFAQDEVKITFKKKELKFFDQFFTQCHQEQERFSKVFEQYGFPIFAFERDFDLRETRLILNPRLMDYDFARIIDPFSAYQEVRMWVDNQAAPSKPIPAIADDTMRDIKGFDKFSFRKPKKGG